MLSLIVQSILIFLTVTIALLLFALPHPRRSRNLPLCAVLILVALHTLTDLTVDTPLLGSLRLHLIPAPLLFLYGPLLYAHCREVAGRPRRMPGVHYLPLLLASGYYLAYGFSHAVFFGCFLLHFGTYAFLIEHTVSRAPQTKDPDIRWMRVFTYSFGAMWLAAIGSTVLAYADLPSPSTYLEQLTFAVCVAFCGALVYYIVVRPGHFMRVRLATSNQERAADELDAAARRRMQQLKTLLATDRDFLASMLDRSFLAETLGIEAQQLSQEINTYFNLSLPELVNMYRIRAARDLLQQTDQNIKEIYYGVGFQSRSVFNTNFRKSTGMTPTQYRKSSKFRSAFEDRTP